MNYSCIAKAALPLTITEVLRTATTDAKSVHTSMTSPVLLSLTSTNVVSGYKVTELSSSLAIVHPQYNDE